MIWFVVAVIDSLIAIRFFMKLLGASYQADFVRFMYGVTAPLVAPFRGIFQSSGSGSYVLEPESLIAIAIYLLIGWAIVALIRIVNTPKSRPVLLARLPPQLGALQTGVALALCAGRAPMTCPRLPYDPYRRTGSLPSRAQEGHDHNAEGIASPLPSSRLAFGVGHATVAVKPVHHATAPAPGRFDCNLRPGRH